MSVTLSDDAQAEIQQKYFYLTNYVADDSTDPIDPLTYVDSNGDALLRLHITAHNGDVRTLQLLLDAGAKIDQPGDIGYPADLSRSLRCAIPFWYGACNCLRRPRWVERRFFMAHQLPYR
jgi:hypothetical protein